MFSSEYCKNFKDNFFIERFWWWLLYKVWMIKFLLASWRMLKVNHEDSRIYICSLEMIDMATSNNK